MIGPEWAVPAFTESLSKFDCLSTVQQPSGDFQLFTKLCMIQLFAWKNVNGWKQSSHGLLTLCLLLGLNPALSNATPLGLGELAKRDDGTSNHDAKIWVSRTTVFISQVS